MPDTNATSHSQLQNTFPPGCKNRQSLRLSNHAFQTPSMLFSRFPRDGLKFLAVGQTCIATPLQIQLLAIKITLKEASLQRRRPFGVWITVPDSRGGTDFKSQIVIRVSHWANVFFFSAMLHRPRKAAGYALPTATAPQAPCGLLHCVACVARLKRRKH